MSNRNKTAREAFVETANYWQIIIYITLLELELGKLFEATTHIETANYLCFVA